MVFLSLRCRGGYVLLAQREECDGRCIPQEIPAKVSTGNRYLSLRKRGLLVSLVVLFACYLLTLQPGAQPHWPS